MLVQCDVGNWFYVLLGIAWIVYSIYKGANKNKKQDQKTESTQKKSSFFDDLLEDFNQETVPQPESDETFDTRVPEPEILDVFEKIPDKTIEPSPDPGKKLSVQEGVPVTEPSPTSSFFEQEAMKKRKKTSRINLRKAVIYSEILHRPYE